MNLAKNDCGGAPMKVVLPFVLLLMVLTGCDPERIARDNLAKQTSNLYHVYLNGGRDEARHSLQDAIRLIEDTQVSPPFRKGQAASLFLGYARLYALERRAGSNDMAQVYLVKARYWCLRQDELDGDNAAGCNAYLAKFAAEDKLMDFIDKWDKGANNGKGPRYIQSP